MSDSAPQQNPPEWVVTPAETSPPEITPQEAGQEPDAKALFAVFRHRNYRVFFTGELVSLMGTWITTVAQGWLIFTLTHSPFLLGLTAFAGQIPVFFFSPFGGMLADRFERRRLMLATQILSGLISASVAALVLSHTIIAAEVIGLALLQGFVNAFDVPARQGMTVEMVGKEDLRHAIALNSMMFNLARVAGPSTAGVIIALVGVGWCFTLDAVSYTAVVAALLAMEFRQRPPTTHERPFQAVIEGFSYVWRTREIRNSLLLIGSNSAFGAAYMSMLPAFAHDVLGRASSELGLLYSAAGLSALLGAYVLARVPDRHLFATPVIGTLLFGSSLILFANCHNFWLALVMLLPAGFSMMILGGATNSIVQLVARDDMRGRVSAFYAVCALGMMPWGSLMLGFLAAHLGVSRALSIGGVCCLVAAALAWWERRAGGWSLSH